MEEQDLSTFKQKFADGLNEVKDSKAPREAWKDYNPLRKFPVDYKMFSELVLIIVFLNIYIFINK